MRSAQAAAIIIGTLVTGATLVSLTGAASSAPQKSATSAKTPKYSARLAFELPSQPRYLATMLGVDPSDAESFRFSPQDIVARTNIPSIAHRAADDPTFQDRVPEYYARFDPEEGEFDRLALTRDLASRITLTASPGSDVLTVRVSDENEKVALELCKLVADIVREANFSARGRRIEAARDVADRIERDLRAQLDALATERANVISTGAVSAASDAGAASELRAKLIDIDLSLIGLPETDTQHATLVQRHDWLRAQLDAAAQAATQRAQSESRLQYIDDQRAIKQELRAAAARAVLACEEELTAPFFLSLDAVPVTESKE